MNLQEQIRKVLREETSLQKNLMGLFKNLGIEPAIAAVGGIKNFIKILYDGDLKSFHKQNEISPYLIVIKRYGPNYTLPEMYISEFLVSELNMDVNNMGKFKWGPKKDNLPYTVFCELNLPSEKLPNGFNYYRVKGKGSGYNFGYGYSNRNIEKTYRKQIFKQIIDKYNLDSYK
jgi:hypothetical protein